jgi:hypothetical protein
VVSGAMIPTAYLASGGGFISMTDNMGTMRAIYDSDVLPLFTHFGGVSGGSRFQTQFSYPKDFYESVIGTEGGSVNEAVAAWGPCT